MYKQFFDQNYIKTSRLYKWWNPFKIISLTQYPFMIVDKESWPLTKKKVSHNKIISLTQNPFMISK